MSRPENISLDEIVAKCLKKRNCTKALKLFEENISIRNNDPAKVSAVGKLEDFIIYLKNLEVEREGKKEYDLGFEINFGAYQPNVKVKFYISTLMRTKALFSSR